MNCLTNADIGSAAADVAVHGGVDVLVGGLGRFREECCGGHHLSSLTVTALRDVEVGPGELHGMRAIGGEALDRRDLGVVRDGDWRLTGAHGAAGDVNGAGAALSDAAAVLGAAEIQNVAKDPEERHVRGSVHRGGPSVYSQFVGHGRILKLQRLQRRTSWAKKSSGNTEHKMAKRSCQTKKINGTGADVGGTNACDSDAAHVRSELRNWEILAGNECFTEMIEQARKEPRRNDRN